MNWIIAGLIICVLIIVIGHLLKFLAKAAVVGVIILIVFVIIDYATDKGISEDLNGSLDRLKESEVYQDAKETVEEKAKEATGKATVYVKEKIIEALENDSEE